MGPNEFKWDDFYITPAEIESGVREAVYHYRRDFNQRAREPTLRPCELGCIHLRAPSTPRAGPDLVSFYGGVEKLCAGTSTECGRLQIISNILYWKCRLVLLKKPHSQVDLSRLHWGLRVRHYIRTGEVFPHAVVRPSACLPRCSKHGIQVPQVLQPLQVKRRNRYRIQPAARCWAATTFCACWTLTTLVSVTNVLNSSGLYGGGLYDSLQSIGQR